MNTIFKLTIAGSLLLISISLLVFIDPGKTLADYSYCTSYASKKCITNVSYWYNSCGVLQDLYQNCNLTNQICQNGLCVNKTSGGQPSGYVKHYTKKCYNNDVYWYSSNGKLQDLYKNCSDDNACTLDTCHNAKCQNVLKCDGSTCAVNSPEYSSYCASNNQTNTNQNQNPYEQNQPSQTTGQAKGLVISIFGKKDSEPLQWEKSLDVKKDDKMYFLLVVKNISSTPFDNVLVTSDITSNIDYAGDLKVDDTVSPGNISSGINLGTLPPNTSRSVDFSGKLKEEGQPFQVVGRVAANNFNDSDSLDIKPSTDQNNATASISNNSLTDFVKKWYPWIIIIVVLTAIFIVIFRRLSTNV